MNRVKTYPDSEARALPHSLEAEAHVIGVLLNDQTAMARIHATLRPEAFYDMANRLIYTAAWDLFGMGETVDRTTIAAKLDREGTLRRAGGLTYMVDLQGDTLESSLTDHHVEIVLDCWRRRQLIGFCREDAGLAHTETFEKVMANHEQHIIKLRSESAGRHYSTAKDGLDEAMEMVKAYQDGSIYKRIIPLGYAFIDRKWKAFAGDYIVICGRPGMGKTSLMMNMAERLAMNSVHPRAIGVISMEMTEDQIMSRMMHGRAQIGASETENSKLPPQTLQKLQKARDELAGAQIYIDDAGTQTPESIRARIQQWKLAHNVEAVFVDYLTMIKAKGINKYERASEASDAMKQIAKDIGVVMVVAAQLSRKTEAHDRSDKRPDLGDLRDSGDIEQGLDLCLGVYRPEYYAAKRLRAGDIDQESYAKTVGKAEIICLKARRGENNWTAHMRWDGPTTRFSDDWPGMGGE